MKGKREKRNWSFNHREFGVKKKRERTNRTGEKGKKEKEKEREKFGRTYIGNMLICHPPIGAN